MVERHPIRAAAGFVALVCAALLAGAHAFERIGGLSPCPLCLLQREVLWTALAATLAAALSPGRFAAAFLIGAGGALFAGALLAGSHAGAERDFWPGPALCSAGALEDAPRDLLRALALPAEAPACDEAPIRIAGLSLADLNALLSLGLGVFAFAAAQRWRHAP